MNHWLMKSEPDAFSWDDLVAKGKAEWDGVRNHAAQLNMKSMKAPISYGERLRKRQSSPTSPLEVM